MKRVRNIQGYHDIPVKYNHWLVVESVTAPKMYTSLIYQANWNYLTGDLKSLYPDRKSLVIKYDYILVHPWDKELIEYCEDIERSLTRYPVLCDDTYQELLQEEINSNIAYDLNQLEGELGLRLFDIHPCFESVEINATEEELFDLYYKAVNNGAYGYQDQSDGSVYLDLENISENLTYLDILTGIEDIRLESLELMPHPMMHELIKHHRSAFYDLEGNRLDYPEFITLQYDKNQLKLF